MEQFIIYDYFAQEEDPLYMKLEKLKGGDTVQIGDYEVHLNPAGIYEISNEETHEGMGSLEKCYEYLFSS